MTWQHQASHRASQRALFLAFTITVAFLVAEVVGGVLTNSLALLADAGHMLSDAAALGLGMFAIWMALRPATATRTYGFHRVEVLAALANGALLVAVAGYIFWQASQRLQDPPEVKSLPMLLVAVAGLGANVAGGSLLFRHSKFIGVLVLVSAWRLLRESLWVLLEAVPPHMDARQIEGALKEVGGVEGVHDLHIWTVTSGFVALTCHAELNANCDIQKVIGALCQMLHERYGIQHVTIQPETTRSRGRRGHRSLPRCTSVSGDGCGR